MTHLCFSHPASRPAGNPVGWTFRMYPSLTPTASTLAPSALILPLSYCKHSLAAAESPQQKGPHLAAESIHRKCPMLLPSLDPSYGPMTPWSPLLPYLLTLFIAHWPLCCSWLWGLSCLRAFVLVLLTWDTLPQVNFFKPLFIYLRQIQRACGGGGEGEGQADPLGSMEPERGLIPQLQDHDPS